MDDHEFGLELILAEEQASQYPVQRGGGSGGGSGGDSGDSGGGSGRESEVWNPLVIDRQDFTTADAFPIKEPGTEFPIEGPGTLIDLLIIADSDQFDVYVEVDGREIVTSSFTRLQDDTVELARISAYQRADDPNYVFDLTQLDFQHQIRAVITPHQEITFRRQRADLNLS
jgi:hypothetical protein